MTQINYDHGAFVGLSDDDHAQYHNDERADTWLGTKSLADLGAKSAGDLSSGELLDPRVVESNVTQHQASLEITKSQVSDFGSYLPLAGGSMIGVTSLDSDWMVDLLNTKLASSGQPGGQTLRVKTSRGAGMPGDILNVCGASGEYFRVKGNGSTQLVSAGSPYTPLVIHGLPSQSADLVQLTDSADVVLSVFDSAGNLSVGSDTADSTLDVAGDIAITDGMTAPSSSAGKAKIYIDSADGALKIIFADGTIKTIVTDS